MCEGWKRISRHEAEFSRISRLEFIIVGDAGGLVASFYSLKTENSNRMGGIE